MTQLENARTIEPAESQMKIHSKIYPADDGFLYFASMDEAGEKSDGSAYPTWGGHLWRMKPFASKWEHLLSTKEALIAVAGSGRWIYALGYFQHMLYQFDTQTGKVQHIQVGSVGGHISRNFLVDLSGHAYVPRAKSRKTASSGKPELVAELVEFDTDLKELQAVPLPDYVATLDFDSHGIVGWTFLADGDLLFTTATGGLWRIHPGEPSAKVTRLRDFHPQGKSYPSCLFTFAGTRYACGLASRSGEDHQWVVYDLETGMSEVVPLDQAPFAKHKKLLLYGSNTKDNAGNAYVGGRAESDPVLFKIVLSETR